MERRKLPANRQGIIHKCEVCGFELFIRTSFFEDGTLGEIFITVAKEGSFVRGLCNTLGITASIALQYGVPWKELERKWIMQKFDPMDDKFVSVVAAIATSINICIERYQHKDKN